MRKFKRLTMTLALLIMAVGGAWAQSSLNVVEFEVPADWEGNNSPVTAADLPGFKTSTFDEAKAWTGAPAEGVAMLIYAFDDEDNAYYVSFTNGAAKDKTEKNTFRKNGIFSIKSYTKIYYTAEPTEWDLKPDMETGKNWILAEMPASNIELQVEYFAESNLFLSKEALADKANIAVKAGDLGVQFGEDGKSANTVTEGTAMTVTYNGTKKLLGMKVEKKSEALIVNPVVGQIIGSDGKNYDANATLPDGVTAVAVIAYVGSETGDDTYKNGLAIALADESSEMNWSTAKSTCEGKTAVSGAAWLLPSQNQWKAMFKANGGNEDSYSGLNSSLATAGGTALQENGIYWSSTENDDDDAYDVYFAGGVANWYGDRKDYNDRVRACLAF